MGNEYVSTNPIFSFQGYLRALLPAQPPERGEAWESILTDLDDVIMPGLTHWESRRFFGYGLVMGGACLLS